MSIAAFIGVLALVVSLLVGVGMYKENRWEGMNRRDSAIVAVLYALFWPVLVVITVLIVLHMAWSVARPRRKKKS